MWLWETLLQWFYQGNSHVNWEHDIYCSSIYREFQGCLYLVDWTVGLDSEKVGLIISGDWNVTGKEADWVTLLEQSNGRKVFKVNWNSQLLSTSSWPTSIINLHYCSKEGINVGINLPDMQSCCELAQCFWLQQSLGLGQVTMETDFKFNHCKQLVLA